MSQSYMKPKVGDPKMLRSERNGQFVNPPLWMVWGGGGSSAMLRRGTNKNLQLEKGGPTARKGKPI
jgi:hypothetical protein